MNEQFDVFIPNIDKCVNNLNELTELLKEKLQEELDISGEFRKIERLDFPIKTRIDAEYVTAFLIMVDRTQHKNVSVPLNGLKFFKRQLADKPSNNETHEESNQLKIKNM